MMINEMKNSRSSDLLPMFYDCKYFFRNVTPAVFNTSGGMGKEAVRLLRWMAERMSI